MIHLDRLRHSDPHFASLGSLYAQGMGIDCLSISAYQRISPEIHFSEPFYFSRYWTSITKKMTNMVKKFDIPTILPRDDDP